MLEAGVLFALYLVPRFLPFVFLSSSLMTSRFKMASIVLKGCPVFLSAGCISRRKYARQTCFLQARVSVLLALGAMLRDGQCILNQASVSRDTHNPRSCSEWLVAERKAGGSQEPRPGFLPQAVLQDSLTQCPLWHHCYKPWDFDCNFSFWNSARVTRKCKIIESLRTHHPVSPSDDVLIVHCPNRDTAIGTILLTQGQALFRFCHLVRVGKRGEYNSMRFYPMYRFK